MAGEGNGTPLQYSCLENPMDGGAGKTGMSRQESRSSAGPDHVSLQALITWLIKYRSRD